MSKQHLKVMGPNCPKIKIEKHNMGVSKNNGTPKSSIFIGFSIINHPFWGTPIFGNTHIFSGGESLQDLREVFPKHFKQQIAAFNFVEPMEKQKDRPQCHLKKSGPFVSLLQRLLRASEPENRINTIFRHQTNSDTVSVPNVATFLGAAISLPIRL